MIVALQTDSGEHLGFILFADSSALSGDCIVRALPTMVELFDSKEFKFLAKIQDAGECQFQRASDFCNLHIFKTGVELYFEGQPGDSILTERRSGLAIIAKLIEDSE